MLKPLFHISARVTARFTGAFILTAVAMGTLATTPFERAWAAGKSSELAHAINEERRVVGLPPLRYEPRLNRIAEEIAQKIATNRQVGDIDARLREAGYPHQEYAVFAEANGEDAVETVRGWRIGNRIPNIFAGGPVKEIGTAWLDGADIDPNIREDVWAVIVAAPTRPAKAGWRKRMLDYVNAFRRQHGLPPLYPEKILDEAAQGHAEDMAKRDYFQHLSPEGQQHGDRARRVGYDYRFALENLAAGQPSARDVVNAWIASKTGHREAMLNPDVTEVGIGYTFLPYGGGNVRAVHYWAMTMARPR